MSKQIYRVFDSNGKMKEDVIGLEDDPPAGGGEPLLKQVVKNGKQVYKFPGLEGVRQNVQVQLASLGDQYKKIRNPDKYPVRVSPKLQNLFDEVKKKHG